MSRTRKIILVVVILVLAFPLSIPCGHLYSTCATAPGPDGIYYTYYEVEPLGITLLETAIGTNLRVYYWSGQDTHMANK